GDGPDVRGVLLCHVLLLGSRGGAAGSAAAAGRVTAATVLARVHSTDRTFRKVPAGCLHRTARRPHPGPVSPTRPWSPATSATPGGPRPTTPGWPRCWTRAPAHRSPAS